MLTVQEFIMMHGKIGIYAILRKVNDSGKGAFLFDRGLNFIFNNDLELFMLRNMDLFKRPENSIFKDSFYYFGHGFYASLINIFSITVPVYGVNADA